MNQIDLKGKRAIVAEGARGIGFGVVRRLLQSGTKITLCEVALTKACVALSPDGEVRSHCLGLTDPAAVAAKAWGGLEVLVAWTCSDECSFSTGTVFDASGGRISV